MLLEKSNRHEWVVCPSCFHGWYIEIPHDLIDKIAHKTIWCPECDTPLKKPELSSSKDLAEKGSSTNKSKES